MTNRRKESGKKGWELEVELFYAMVAEFDETLTKYPVPRKYMPEKILQGPFMDAFTHVGQLALLRRMAGSPIEGESYWMTDVQIGKVGPDQPIRITK